MTRPHSSGPPRGCQPGCRTVSEHSGVTRREHLPATSLSVLQALPTNGARSQQIPPTGDAGPLLQPAHGRQQRSRPFQLRGHLLVAPPCLPPLLLLGGGMVCLAAVTSMQFIKHSLNTHKGLGTARSWGSCSSPLPVLIRARVEEYSKREKA